MTSTNFEVKTVEEMSAVEEAQIESLFGKLRFSEARGLAVEDNISKSVLIAEEIGGDIDEVFVKLYGQPGKAIGIEEQRKILQRRTMDRQDCKELDDRQETQSNQIPGISNDKPESKRPKVDEYTIKPKTVSIENAAEVDWDSVFEEMGNSEADKQASAETDSNSSCVIL